MKRLDLTLLIDRNGAIGNIHAVPCPEIQTAAADSSRPGSAA